MTRTAILTSLVGIFFCATSVFAQSDEVTGSVNEDGFIVLSGINVELFGVDLMSAQELLVPIPDGDSSPFGFLLKNERGQITYGSLSTPVTLQGTLVLSARYTGDGFGSDLVGQWGGPELDGPIAFPTSPPDDGGMTDPDPVIPDPDPTPDPVVPEPNASTLALIACIFLAASRRRKQ